MSTDWNSYSHQDLFNMLAEANPEELHARAVTVQNLARDMHNVTFDTQNNAQRALSSWSGPAAENATHAFNGVTNWADSSARVTSRIAHGLGQYADAVDKARANMPEPVALTDEQHSAMMGDAGAMQRVQASPDAAQQMTKIQDATTAKTKAVEVMRQYQAESHTISQEMPTYEKPPTVGKVGYDTITPPTTGPIGPPPPGPGPVTTPPGTTDPRGTTTPGGPGDPDAPGDGGQTDLQSTPTLTEPGVIGPGDTGITGLGDLAAPGGPGPGAGGAGGVGGFGRFGGIGAVGDAATSGAAGPASSEAALGAGAQSGAAAEEEAVAARAAQAAAAEGEAGWGGFPMMGAPGMGGQRDNEHRNKYADKPDVIGDLPPAFPPVLGL